VNWSLCPLLSRAVRLA